MHLSKELTTVTPLSKSLALFFFVLFPFIGFYLGLHYQQITDEQKLVSLQATSKQTFPTSNNAVFPTIVSQEKNIPLNTKIAPSKNAVTITFPDATNTTYNQTVYNYRGENFVLYDLHLNNPSFIGQVQKFSEENNNYLNFVYEGQTINSADILMKQLAQPEGFYPQTIYDSAYEIFTNKNGIKMKREYLDVFGAITDKVEFISHFPFDTTYPYRYYHFETNGSILGTNFDKTEFANNPAVWIKNNPQKNISALNSFIDTIKDIGY